MDSIKLNLSVNVNVDLSQSTKEFLSQFFGTTRYMPTVEKKAEQAPASAVEKKVEQAPASVVEKKAEQAPASVVENKAEISIEDVRKALAEKVNDHRETIKNKLTELGAPSVTKLAKDKYCEMLEFLTSL